MKLFTTGLLPVISLVLIFLPEPAASQDILRELKEKFRQGQVLQAQMLHLFTDAYTGEESQTEGDILIGENRYKIVVDDQIVVVDGELSRVYNKHQNKVIISYYEPEDDDFAPSRFLAADEHQYDVEQAGSGVADILLVLTTDDPFEVFTRVEIHLTRQRIPVLIEAIDQTGSRFSTAFSEAGYITPDEETFSFPHPEDADLIDLRQ